MTEPIFHITQRKDLVWDAEDRYRPASLASEGFIHASYREKVAESARLYFPSGADLVVLAIDEAKLEGRLDIAQTPRGPMPHIHGALNRDAVVAEHDLTEF